MHRGAGALDGTIPVPPRALPPLLAWALPVVGVAFVGEARGGGRGEEPAAWKQVVWLLLLVGGIPGSVVLIGTLRRILGGA